MSETANTITRNQRKERTGEVVSSKMQKTIVVSVKRRFPHPQFKKVVTSFKKFYAHDEKSEAKVGDVVRIEMNDRSGASVFGAIEQKITAAGA